MELLIAHPMTIELSVSTNSNRSCFSMTPGPCWFNWRLWMTSLCRNGCVA